MKRNILIALLTVFCSALLLLLSGCSLQGREGSSTSDAPKKTASVITPDVNVPTAVPKGIPVLMYHKIGPDKDNDAVISEELFKKQMKLLKEEGFHPISMQQLYDYVTKGTPVPVKPVVLTFDDGYADTYSIVFPVLKEYGFDATFFVNPGDVGQRMTWAQLKEMKEAGYTIANHGYQHIHMKELTNAQQVENIQKGQEALKDKLGISNVWFCYPYGSFNTYSEEACKANNIKTALSMNPGWVHVGDNPYTLHRIWIGNAVDLNHFRERITTEHYTDL